MHTKLLVFAETKVNFLYRVVEEFNDASLGHIVVVFGFPRTPSDNKKKKQYFEYEMFDIYDEKIHCARVCVCVDVCVCMTTTKKFLSFYRISRKIAKTLEHK